MEKTFGIRAFFRFVFIGIIYIFAVTNKQKPMTIIQLEYLLAVANFSGERFMDKYKEMNKKFSQTKISPLEFISQINQKHFDGKLEVIQVSKVASDSYSRGKLFLSTDTINIPSLASFTIIAHELGHAMQDKTGRKLKKLSKLRKLGRFLGLLMVPSLLAGGIILLLEENLFWWGAGLCGFSAFIFILALFIKLRTISIEKDASKKAIKFLNEFFSDAEVKQCRLFLNDARMTYWADFLRLCLGWTAMSKKTKLFN